MPMRALGVVLVLAALVGGLVFAVLQGSGSECEACVDYKGHRVCKTVSAGTPEEARQHAVTTACAVLTRGVTETIECQNQPPSSLSCR